MKSSIPGFEMPNIGGILKSIHAIQPAVKITELHRIMQQHKQTMETLKSNIPKVNNSVLESIKDIQSVLQTSDFQNVLKQHKQTMETLKFNIPKINNSVLESIKSIQSVFQMSDFQNMLKQHKQTMESLNFKVPKLDISVLQDLEVREKYLKELKIDKGFDEVVSSGLSENNIKEIENLNDKIDNQHKFSQEDWKKYFYFSAIILGLISSFITILVFLLPDEQVVEMIEAMQVENKNMSQKISEIQATVTREFYYEVTKGVRVRISPSTNIESKIIDIAFSKQKLLLVSKLPYWLQVEYFNEEKQETVIGWVSKKYTKRLE